MLTNLTIRNYALITHASIDFTHNLTIITGETGAGKSILLDALGLVLGKRADLNTLRNKEEKCVIEAHFTITAIKCNSFLKDLIWIMNQKPSFAEKFFLRENRVLL